MNETDIILLGQALGLLRSKLKKIKSLPDDMIDAWLHQADNVQETTGPPTWKSLCEALRKIDQPGIALKIEKKGILFFMITCMTLVECECFHIAELTTAERLISL